MWFLLSKAIFGFGTSANLNFIAWLKVEKIGIGPYFKKMQLENFSFDNAIG